MDLDPSMGLKVHRGPLVPMLHGVKLTKLFLLALIAAPLLWVMSITELQVASTALGLGDIHSVSAATDHAADLFGLIVVGPVVEEVIFRFVAIRLLVRWLPS